VLGPEGLQFTSCTTQLLVSFEVPVVPTRITGGLSLCVCLPIAYRYQQWGDRATQTHEYKAWSPTKTDRFARGFGIARRQERMGFLVYGGAVSWRLAVVNPVLAQ
jgi:hypothetical protein